MVTEYLSLDTNRLIRIRVNLLNSCQSRSDIPDINTKFMLPQVIWTLLFLPSLRSPLSLVRLTLNCPSPRGICFPLEMGCWCKEEGRGEVFYWFVGQLVYSSFCSLEACMLVHFDGNWKRTLFFCLIRILWTPFLQFTYLTWTMVSPLSLIWVACVWMHFLLTGSYCVILVNGGSLWA